MKMSKYPENSYVFDWGDDWKESKKVCPKCKNVYMWVTGWYDDPKEAGGACIGEQYECGNCGYFEEH